MCRHGSCARYHSSKYVLPHPASTNFLIILLHIKKGIGENGKYSNGRTVTVGDGYNANFGRTFKSLKAVKLSIINNGYSRGEKHFQQYDGSFG